MLGSDVIRPLVTGDGRTDRRTDDDMDEVVKRFVYALPSLNGASEIVIETPSHIEEVSLSTSILSKFRRIKDRKPNFVYNKIGM